ncbi:DNA polymerase III subunit gamma/tau [Uliginosibacterium sediminicola]|uniref:DNA polymerase III subunit gamma/tau n=1 Tax=Uliginosibacterium sediminicola TaxID=2024550 RepID=A0ABU9YYL4_9RHOO
MSYQVLARKWRPKSFDTLVGQEHVVRALSHALGTGRLHHAYLFTGTRGVGKTTISRILAKSLNCETGITATPCGVCTACTEIDAGRFVDYVEMDAASNRGVDDMAALLEKAAYAPARGRYKVYMIDEVHMLTGHAFNAMLKTLEEPPEHMKFILATTDPQKIPVTVLSRCLQFNLKQMPQTHIIEHLTRILGEEGVSFEPGALRHLAKGANGSMRDALSLLDQAIAHGAGKVEEEQVIDMLGTVGDDHLYALLDALAAQDIDAMLAAAETMEARALSFDDALQTLASLLHRIALVQFAPNAVSDSFERERLQVYAGQFHAEFLQLAYQIVVHGREELALAPDELTGFSMCLLRLHAFRPDSGGAAPSATPPAAPGAGGGQARKLPDFAALKPAAAPAPAPAPAAPPPARAAAPAPAPAPAAAAPVASAASAGAEAAPAGLPHEAPPWHELILAMQLGGLVRELAQNCELLSMQGNAVQLRLTPTHKHLLAMPGTQAKLQEALARHYQGAVRLNIEIGDPAAQTPAQRSAEAQRQRHGEAVAALESDPFVQELIERFDATLVESSVKPL